MYALAGIIILGIFAQWLAWRIRVPSILPLIIIGLFIGPLSTLFTADGCKLLQPMLDKSTAPQCVNFLFPGDYLFYFVSLAIGVILFEGGLTLKKKEIEDVGPSILKLITLGSLITLVGAGLAAHFVMGLGWDISFLFAALIIVTGPTVIVPILQNIPLTRNISTVLKWEGILIDPIGALVAVLFYEFIVSGEGIGYTGQAFKTFLTIIAIGGFMGFVAAHWMYQMIKREWIPSYLLNVFTLASVLGVFAMSDWVAHESGLLAVVVMGVVMGNLEVPRIHDILSFKEDLSILLISILFILLAANINMEDLELLLDWRCGLLFGIVVLILRPLAVFGSTHKSGLNVNEKMFVSWVGPRGIVAAGVASLFGLKLIAQGVEGANYITPLVFMIVLGTVVLNATTARLIAKLLRVIEDSSEGILIIGANRAARLIAVYLNKNNRHVVLVDNNGRNVQNAMDEGLEAFQANIYTDDLGDHIELVDMGFLMAITGSPDVNQYACNTFKHNFGEKGTFRLMSPEELKMDKSELKERGLLSPTDDFINMMEVARDYPQVNELELNSKEHFQKIIALIIASQTTIAMFIKRTEGRFDILPIDYEQMTIMEGDKLVYFGEEVVNQNTLQP